MKNAVFPIVILLFVLSCQNKSPKGESTDNSKKNSSTETQSDPKSDVKSGTYSDSDAYSDFDSNSDSDANSDLENNANDQDKKVYVSQSLDEQTANNLKVFLKNYVGEDYSFLKEIDKKFEFYKTDLNGDGKDEIFVRLMGPYFCGTGGCTFLLLDKYGEIITKFSVTRAPIFIEPTKVNDWALLLVKDSGVFKELAFKDGTYPSNPSVLPKAPYDAPSGHAQILFDETLSKSKTFEF